MMLRQIFPMGALLALTWGHQALAEPSVETRYLSSGKVKLLMDRPLGGSVDVLFVGDNSASMAYHAPALEKATQAFGNSLQKTGLDFHLGLVSTSIDQDGATLIGTPPVLRKGQPETGAQLKRKMLQNGFQGSNDEKPVLATLRALVNAVNQGFHRREAALYVMIYTDEDDQSELSVEEFIEQLSALKPAASPVKIDVLAPEKTCNGSFSPGQMTKLQALTQSFNGVFIDLCQNDPAAYMAQAVNGIEQMTAPSHPVSVQLPLIPILGTLKVTWGSQVIPAGDLRRGWTFDSETGTLTLGAEISWTAQPSDTQLEIIFESEEWPRRR